MFLHYLYILKGQKFNINDSQWPRSVTNIIAMLHSVKIESLFVMYFAWLTFIMVTVTVNILIGIEA